MRHATRTWADRHSALLVKGVLFWAVFAIAGLLGIRLLDGVVGRSADRLAISLPSDTQLAGTWTGDSMTLRSHLTGDWLEADLWTTGPHRILLRSFTLHRGRGQGLLHLRHVFTGDDANGPTLSLSGSLLTLQLPSGETGRTTRLSFHRVP
jgi:hypothetical protein